MVFSVWTISCQLISEGKKRTLLINLKKGGGKMFARFHRKSFVDFMRLKRLEIALHAFFVVEVSPRGK